MSEEIPETVDINVNVIDGDSQAVEGATVVIGEVTATTDASGDCTLEEVPYGATTITVTADGFTDYTQEVTVDETTTSIEVELTAVVPQTVDISVTVTDGDSQAVEGATVAVADTEITATTGAAGGCTLRDVPIGTVTITATKEGYINYSNSETVTAETTSLTITMTSE